MNATVKFEISNHSTTSITSEPDAEASPRSQLWDTCRCDLDLTDSSDFILVVLYWKWRNEAVADCVFRSLVFHEKTLFREESTRGESDAEASPRS